MGHEILYCGRCATRIAGTDFEKAKAFRLGGRAICAACIPELLPTLTPAEQQELSLSSTKMRVVKEQAQARGISFRLPPAMRKDDPSSRTGLIVGLSVGALVLVGVLAAMLLRSSPEPATRTVEPIPVAKTTAPPIEEKKEDLQLRDARDAVEAARARAKAAPDDLDGQIAAWDDAVRKSALTPYFKEATAALNELREKKTALTPTPPKDLRKPVVVPPVDPVVKPASAEFQAYLARWESAMARASALDFDGAIADLGRAAVEIPDEGVKRDARADAALLQRARVLRADGLGALSQLSRGQTIGVEARNDAGERKRIEGTVVRAANGRAEIRRGEETVWVEAEDLTAGSLAQLVGPSEEEDLRAFAALCLLEGDRDAAERIAGAEAVPERYREYSKAAASKVPKPSAREGEARRRFYAAEREFAKSDTLAAAVSKYKSLAEDYADTSVVKSEAPRIRKRTEAGRDYVFVAGALKGTGTFALSPAPRTEVAWVSKANVEGSKETLENFVEVEFAALPDTAYRCWALVGGCCAETFAFYLQSTEAMETHPKTKQKVSIDPGAEMAATVRPPITNLKKTHEEHKIKGAKTHPKTAARWEWVTIPLPKYSAAGAKKVRLISDQQGFGVGAIVVSSIRTATIPDPELKEEIARVRSTYAAAQEGLIGWWRLDETAGTFVADAVEGGHPGVLKGAGKWTAGKVGGGLKLDPGIDVQVELASTVKTVTLSAWVKHDEFIGNQQRYVSLGNETAVIRCVGRGSLHFYIRTGGQHRHLHAPGAVEVGKWALITGTWDGKTQKLYKDGVLLQSQQPGGAFVGDVKRVYIGAAWESMRGVIDEARVYDRALTEAEIKKLHADGSAGTISEIAVAPPAPVGKPWRPLFDGATLSCLRGSTSSWRVENGALAYVPGTDDAVQTREDFGDGELRIRFEVKEATRLWFTLRQGAGTGYGLELTPQLKSLEGKPHEVIFVANGEQVTATLDGKPFGVTPFGATKSGPLQFNASGKMARILSLDVR